MTDTPPILPRPRIASPCISICRLDPFEDLCVGCMRTTQELKDWIRYTDDERRVIMEQLQERRAMRRQKKRGP